MYLAWQRFSQSLAPLNKFLSTTTCNNTFLSDVTVLNVTVLIHPRRYIYSAVGHFSILIKHIQYAGLTRGGDVLDLPPSRHSQVAQDREDRKTSDEAGQTVPERHYQGVSGLANLSGENKVEITSRTTWKSNRFFVTVPPHPLPGTAIKFSVADKNATYFPS